MARDPGQRFNSANSNEHVEVASFKALEGKTWNHPVVVDDRLYIRNSQEAAAYQLRERAQSRTVPTHPRIS
jgi:hypothetical protein